MSEQYLRALEAAKLAHAQIVNAIGKFNSEWESKGASAYMPSGEIRIIMDAASENSKSYTFNYAELFKA